MKKIFSIVLFILILLLTACGSASTSKTNDNDSNSTTANVEDEDNADVTNEDLEPEEEIVEESKVLVITLDEVIAIEDFAEITVKGNKFGKRIDPPNPGSFYTYYENEDQDEIFLDTVISVKSLLTSGKRSDEFLDVKIIYDDKYEYRTFSTIEERGGSDFTYTNITSIEPLQTGTLHFLASVPAQVENDGKPLKAIISVNGEEYEQIIR